MRAIFIFALIVASACATSYHSSGFTGGYNETQLGDDTFQIFFAGNGYTSVERATDFAMLRSSEVARDHGFSFFVVHEREQSSTVSGGTNFTLSSPNSAIVIVCYREKPLDTAVVVYDAEYVYESVTAKYGIDRHPARKASAVTASAIKG